MSQDVTNFEENVVKASHVKPVLVDFWAPWCGPCRVLGPVLEKLAVEQADRWTLAKVNTDVLQKESQEYGIRGIPAVKLFIEGKVVDEFTGALPEPAVRKWLEKAIPSKSDGLLREAENLLNDGDGNAAAGLLENLVATESSNARATALLARCLAFSDPERALALASKAGRSEPKYIPIQEAIHVLNDFRDRIHGNVPFPDGEGRDDLIRALTALSDNRLEEVVMAIVEILKVNRYYEEDAARKIGVAIFTLLGDRHPLARSYRRTFDMWLT